MSSSSQSKKLSKFGKKYKKPEFKRSMSMPRGQDVDQSALDDSSGQSNTSKVKKQVRFPDIEGEGPLTRVMKLKQYKSKRPKKAARKTAEKVRSDKNSCACVIF